MDDVTFCVEKNVPIVPEEGEEEEATVSLASVDLKLQHWSHHIRQPCFWFLLTSLGHFSGPKTSNEKSENYKDWGIKFNYQLKNSFKIVTVLRM